MIGARMARPITRTVMAASTTLLCRGPALPISEDDIRREMPFKLVSPVSATPALSAAPPTQTAPPTHLATLTPGRPRRGWCHMRSAFKLTVALLALLIIAAPVVAQESPTPGG